jgi:hypothetical protein
MSNRPPEESAVEDTYWKTLLNRDPISVCERTLALVGENQEAYKLNVLDRAYIIIPDSKTIVTEVGFGSSKLDGDIRLLILTYLTGATTTPLQGRWVTPVEFSGGDLFFSSDAHNLAFRELLNAFNSAEDFLKAGQKLGGKKDKIGDSSFVLLTLPRIPILFIYWAGDEELPSKISVLVDESARNHLAIDALWLAIRISEKRLLEVGKLMNDSSVCTRKERSTLSE